MSRARIALQPAWVLKATPYGDTSLLVETLTRRHGRVGLVARGARSTRSRSRGLLQPFQPLLLSWTEAGDLGTLTGVEAGGSPIGLPGEAVFSGWYLNELLLRLLHRHEEHVDVFEAYGAALAALPTRLEPALRGFEMRLLAELGFGLDLPEDLEPERFYRYEPLQGPVPLPVPAADALPGHALIALRDDALETPEQLRIARRLLHGALAAHLGGRPLATAGMLRALRQQTR